MELIEYNVFRRDTRSASGKAKYDASDILASVGFSPLYTPSSMRTLRVLQQAISVSRIPHGSIVAVQYPGNKTFFYHLLKRRNVKSIAIVHDVDSLRDATNRHEEAKALSIFDCLITHNSVMTHVVRDLGYNGQIVELGLFDYLSKNETVCSDREKDTVCFAGNFEKATFINKLNNLDDLNFNLFGLAKPKTAKNVYYCGSFSSEQIASHINGCWGLVWDGDSLNECSGAYGQYLRYNCPHKASMYIVAERPLIVWDQAAIAQIVKQEGIGITVSSLYDVANAINNVTEDSYKGMLKNVQRVKQELTTGSHLRNAIGRALKELS